MSVHPEPGTAALAPLALNEAIDPGEAQLLAAAAEFNLTLVTGDKRAVRALKHLREAHAPLAGRNVTLEAILLRLCERLGSENLRQRVGPLTAHDKSVGVCFSSGSSDPRNGLRSYYENLAAEVHPLLLWNPSTEDCL